MARKAAGLQTGAQPLLIISPEEQLRIKDIHNEDMRERVITFDMQTNSEKLKQEMEGVKIEGEREGNKVKIEWDNVKIEWDKVKIEEEKVKVEQDKVNRIKDVATLMKEANNRELTEEDKIAMRAEICKVTTGTPPVDSPYTGIPGKPNAGFNGTPPVPRTTALKWNKKISISGRCKELGFDGPEYTRGAMVKIGMIANRLYIATNGKPPPTATTTGGKKIYIAPQDIEVVDEAIGFFAANILKFA
eukprot:692203-Rhodomonas_salina.1